jgi:uncharacterized protein
MPLIPSAEQITRDIRELMPQAQAAWLYGSAAKGEATADSDIDVAVILNANAAHDAWALSQQASILSDRWGIEVDLVNFQTAPCVLQKEILQAQRRLFASDVAQTDNYELFALSQYRAYRARFAQDFERIAASGKVMEQPHAR